MVICIYCDVAKTKSTRNICEDCKEIYTEKQQKICTKCNETKDWEKFGNNKATLFGLQPICKLCASIQKFNRFNECADSFFRRLLSSCRSNLKNKKRELGEMTLTLEQLKAKWVEQKGKCKISGVPMFTGVHIDFKASVERSNNNITYTDENTILIIFELNIGQGKQITRELLLDMCAPDPHPHPLMDEIESPKTTKKIKASNSPLVTKMIDGELNNQCKICQMFYTIPNFSMRMDTKRLSRICRGCVSEKEKEYHITLEGKLNRIHAHAKHTTIKRNSVANRFQTSFEITKEDLINQFKHQGGKCYYSGKNMSVDGKENFHVSLERLNVNIGYTKENIVFICEELNTSDCSASISLHNQEKKGSGGWSKEKFEKFRNSVNENRSEEEILSTQLRNLNISNKKG